MTSGNDDEWKNLAAQMSPRELRVLRERLGTDPRSMSQEMAPITSRLRKIEEKVRAHNEKRPPPTHTQPRVIADERGVWVADGGGTHYGVGWEELCAVSASKVDMKSQTEIVLGLDVSHGETVEINASSTGFSGLVDQLTQRLALEGTWFETLGEHFTVSDLVVVWTSSGGQSGGKT